MLAKNRDKPQPAVEEVVSQGGVLAIRTRGDDYYSAGINRYGVGFVSTAINPPEWTRAVEEGKIALAGSIMQKWQSGKESPTRILSKMFAQMTTPDEVLDCLANSALRWFGYHVIAANARGGLVLEMSDRVIHARELNSEDVITNHFIHIADGPQRVSDYPSSFFRREQTANRLSTLSTAVEIQNFLRPVLGAAPSLVWRKDTFLTVSTTILELKTQSLLYANQRTGLMKRYRMQKNSYHETEVIL